MGGPFLLQGIFPTQGSKPVIHELSGNPKFRVTDVKDIYTTGVEQQTRGGRKKTDELENRTVGMPYQSSEKE